MEILTILQMCLALSAPDFHLSHSRQNLACQSVPQIYEVSKKYNFSPTLLLSLIYVESAWNKRVVSSAGACGLTQVMPKYTGGQATKRKKYSCNQLKRPRTSIAVGAGILAWWIRHHKGNIDRALCGYNAGFRCKGPKPNRQGMKYSRKVLEIKKKINKRL